MQSTGVGGTADAPSPHRERPALVAAALLVALAAALPLAGSLDLLPRGSEGLRRLLAFAPLGLGLAGVGLLLRPVRSRPALLAAFVGAGWSVLLCSFFLRPEGPGAWADDSTLFYRMAEEWPWRPEGWWRYRVLVPTAVHLLPLTTNLAYLLVAAASIAAAAPILSLLLRDLGYGPAARHAGVALYLCSFAPLYNAYNYALPDPAAMVVLLLAARALARGRDGELALWLAVGCLTKEVALFLVPVRWLLRRGEEGDRRGLLRSALVASPAALLFLVFRVLPSEAATYTDFVTGAAWLNPWRNEPGNLGRLYSPFAAGWALILVAAHAPGRWARAGAPFAALVLASLLVTDAGRILVYLLPFAVPMMLDGAGMGAGSGRPDARAWLLVALACLSMRLWEPFLLFWRIPAAPRNAAALLLAAVVLALALRARRPAAAAAGP